MSPEMFEGESKGGNDHRLADVWAAGVCIFCMTEVKFPFSVGGNGGAADGFDLRNPNADHLAMMKKIQQAKWSLKPGHPPVSHQLTLVISFIRSPMDFPTTACMNVPAYATLPCRATRLSSRSLCV